MKNRGGEKLKEMAGTLWRSMFISLSPDEDYPSDGKLFKQFRFSCKTGQNGLPETVTDTILFLDPGGKVSHPHMISFDPWGQKGISY